MYHVTREIDFCYGHRLLNYSGKCRFLHGHNGRAVIDIAAESLDERGMVFDFSDVKKVIAGWIDENLDHRMILNRQDPVPELVRAMSSFWLCFPIKKNKKAWLAWARERGYMGD